jgi:hypothetical protein
VKTAKCKVELLSVEQFWQEQIVLFMYHCACKTVLSCVECVKIAKEGKTLKCCFRVKMNQ